MVYLQDGEIAVIRRDKALEVVNLDNVLQNPEVRDVYKRQVYPFPLSWLAAASPAGPAPIMATFRPLRSMFRGLM